MTADQTASIKRDVDAALSSFIEQWAQRASNHPGDIAFDRALSNLVDMAFCAGQSTPSDGRFTALMSALKKVLPPDVKLALVAAFGKDQTEKDRPQTEDDHA